MKQQSMQRPRIVVPRVVQDKTMAHIRSCGARCEEGFVVWSGILTSKDLFVSSVLAPPCNGSEHFGGLTISDEAMQYLADEMIRNGEALIAQVHSHPREAFHSETDNSYPLIHRLGFLSIVIPFFGRYGFNEFHRFRTYEYIENGRWRELDGSTKRKRFKLEGVSRWKPIRTMKSFIRARDN